MQENQSQKWGLSARFTVTAADDVGILSLPDINPSTWPEENLLMQYGNELIGLQSLPAYANTSGKRSAKEAQAMQAALNVRLDFAASMIRQSLKDIFWQIHHLKLQYGEDELQTDVAAEDGRAEQFTIPKQVLAQDYQLDVYGLGAPLDRAGRRDDAMTLYALMQQNPLIGKDLTRVWALTRILLEEFERPDVTALIGTREQAGQQQQQMQAAQEKEHQEQLQIQLASHAKNAPPSQTAGAPKPPQPPQQPQPGPPNPMAALAGAGAGA